jgi:hypothetical protein
MYAVVVSAPEARWTHYASLKKKIYGSFRSPTAQAAVAPTE